MTTQEEKARQFAAYHRDPGIFLIPNPWDIGSARLLALEGFKALATTSAGCAFALGVPDTKVGRDAVLAHVRQIVDATRLPVNADLENGFGDAPERVAETIRLAALTGIAGGSIEDACEGRVYDRALAVERVQAAVEAVRALGFEFVFTARCENYLCGNPDLDDTIERLVAYRDAGADVLYAPGIKTEADIAAVVAAVQRPVNVLAGLAGFALSVDALASLGVKRVSVGGSLARAAYGGFLRAVQEIAHQGTFAYADSAVPHAQLDALFARADGSAR
jgi:2-methylisocitrate lyase-like PEP mutase family enzyme